MATIEHVNKQIVAARKEHDKWGSRLGSLLAERQQMLEKLNKEEV